MVRHSIGGEADEQELPDRCADQWRRRMCCTIRVNCWSLRGVRLELVKGVWHGEKEKCSASRVQHVMKASDCECEIHAYMT